VDAARGDASLFETGEKEKCFELLSKHESSFLRAIARAIARSCVALKNFLSVVCKIGLTISLQNDVAKINTPSCVEKDRLHVRKNQNSRLTMVQW